MEKFDRVMRFFNGLFDVTLTTSGIFFLFGYLFNNQFVIMNGVGFMIVSLLLLVVSFLALLGFICYLSILNLYDWCCIKSNQQEEQPYNEEYESKAGTINPKQDTAYICYPNGDIKLISFINGLVLLEGRQVGIVLHPTYFKINGQVLHLNEWHPNRVSVCKTFRMAVDITSLDQIKTRKMYAVYVDNQLLQMEEEVLVIDNKCYSGNKYSRRYEGTIKEYVECMGYNKLDVIEDDNSVLTFHPERYKTDGNNLVKV